MGENCANTSVMPKLIDLVGKQFGRLTVVSRLNEVGSRPKWLCKCECGNTADVRSGDLLSGATSSCGCLRDERVRATITKHGAAPRSGKDAEYSIWCMMKRRCSPQNHQGDRKYYYAKGIRVCEEWQNDYAAFIAHVGPRPSPKHTIDRYPNPNGNYEPGNVRWATWHEQRINH